MPYPGYTPKTKKLAVNGTKYAPNASTVPNYTESISITKNTQKKNYKMPSIKQ